MSRYADPGFWVDACDLAWSVAAKAGLAAIGTRVLGLVQVDWVGALNVAALAALVSLLTSVARRSSDGKQEIA